MRVVYHTMKSRNRFLLSTNSVALILFLCSLTAAVILVQMTVVLSRRDDSSQMANTKANVTLAYVLGGNSWVNKWFVNHMKSLVVNTKANLMLHVVTDEKTNESLKLYLDSWGIDRVTYQFYDIAKFEKKVEWIPNQHYSKTFGLIKLLLPEIIAVEKVLYIDVDTLIRCDIEELWNYFNDFASNQAIGVTLNQSPWYTKNDSRPQPALATLFGKKWSTTSNTKPTYRFWSAWPGDVLSKMLLTVSKPEHISTTVDKERGFNTGVMLLQLENMRKMNWDKVWRNSAKQYLKVYGSTKLADQDIFNAIIFTYPKIAHLIPCEFNYQQGVNTGNVYCDEYAKVIHWNSKNKSASNGYQAEELEDYKTHMEAFNGDSVKTQRNYFHKKRKTGQLHGFCGPYLPEEHYRTFPNFLRAEVANSTATLFTQMSADRIENFKRMANSWLEPISVAVYGSDEELNKVIPKIQSLNRSNIAVHLVYRAVNDKVYPINFLRNVALTYTETEYVMSLDVDFIVRVDVKALDKHLDNLVEKQAYVIPAFELTNNDYNFENNEVPKTKAEAEKMLSERKLQSFRRTIFPAGQDPTNATMWVRSKMVYQVEWKPNYEPYILMRKCEIPKYEKHFGGFGWNKVTHIMTMKLRDIHFLVLPDAFVVHQFHTASEDLIRFRTDEGYRRCLRYMKVQFIENVIMKNRIDLSNL